MFPAVFEKDELSCRRPLPKDLQGVRDRLEALLDDERVEVLGAPKLGQNHYRLSIRVEDETTDVDFVFDGDRQMTYVRERYGVPSVRLLLRHVIRTNGLLDWRFLKLPEARPEEVRCTIKARPPQRASSGTNPLPYEARPSVVGEAYFARWLRERLPGHEVQWLNEHGESRQSYDILVDHRVFVDVKTTGAYLEDLVLPPGEGQVMLEHWTRYVIASVELGKDNKVRQHLLYSPRDPRGQVFQRLTDDAFLALIHSAAQGEMPECLPMPSATSPIMSSASSGPGLVPPTLHTTVGRPVMGDTPVRIGRGQPLFRLFVDSIWAKRRSRSADVE